MTQNFEPGRPRPDPVLSVRSEASADQAIQRLLDQPLLPDDLREATERVARPLQPPEKEILRLLAFRLSGERFAVEARSVAKVTHAVRVHRIPHRSNAIIRGFCHVDGDLLLCADLCNLLELEPTTDLGQTTPADSDITNQQRMIVLECQGRLWGIEVEAVDGVIPVVPASLQAPPLTVDAQRGHYTAHVMELQNRLVAVLDLPRVVHGFQAALS
jgi:chemotaxis signal transduction protein